MKFDLDHLRVFYEVVKAGSFTKAAVNLHISQPSVSRSIRLLEYRLGFALFERSPRGIKLSLKGEKFAEFAARVVEEANLITEILNDLTDEPQGELKIATTPAMASIWLPKYLPGFLARYPRLRIKIIAKIEGVEAERADVMIRPFIPHHTSLIQRHFITHHNKLWASPEYLKKYGTPKKPAELDNHQLITYEENVISPYGNNNWILECGARPGHTRKPFLQINLLDGLMNFATEGLGIVELPEEYVKLRNLNLVRVLPDNEAPKIELFYIYHEKAKKSKRVTALADYLESLDLEK